MIGLTTRHAVCRIISSPRLAELTVLPLNKKAKLFTIFRLNLENGFEKVASPWVASFFFFFFFFFFVFFVFLFFVFFCSFVFFVIVFWFFFLFFFFFFFFFFLFFSLFFYYMYFPVMFQR